MAWIELTTLDNDIKCLINTRFILRVTTSITSDSLSPTLAPGTTLVERIGLNRKDSGHYGQTIRFWAVKESYEEVKQMIQRAENGGFRQNEKGKYPKRFEKLNRGVASEQQEEEEGTDKSE